jgi:hypothetical protein
VTQPELPAGVPTGGKPISLAQLEQEIVAAGASMLHGLGMAEELGVIFTYDGAEPSDFDPADVPLVEGAITAHVAMRDKTDEEYQLEFATATTSRRGEINSIMTGLLPREPVPV